ncbi:restin homolog [Amblyraja radiata]|uniref:restin homolog n=1 Tax=Amblyraja radiata TaxID=386614 RepID=UPI001403DFA8|nr:restin homolog [Amblyraja radiata]
MSLLESRVKSVEEANCSLLKEIGKLQNELKQVGGEACGFRDQTTSWSSIMGNIEVSNNTISKIMSRLKEAEGTLYSEKLSMIMLLNRAQQLELMITDNEEEMKSQRNQSERRLAELQSVVQNIHGQKVQTERMVSTLMSDVGQGKNQMELQESEIKLVKEELKQVSQQMDEENKLTVSIGEIIFNILGLCQMFVNALNLDEYICMLCTFFYFLKILSKTSETDKFILTDFYMQLICLKFFEDTVSQTKFATLISKYVAKASLAL